MKHKAYILEQGKSAEKRLIHLNEIFGKYSEGFLSNFDLIGKRVLELGSGTGNMTLWLAEKVGPNGQVVAVDSSYEQLEIIKKKAEEKNIKNIELVNEDASSLKLEENSFDLAYCRFLLMHVVEPVDILNHMRNSVRHNGLMAIEEFTGEGERSFCKKENHLLMMPFFKKVSEKMIHVHNVGNFVIDYMIKNNLVIENSNFVQPIRHLHDAAKFYFSSWSESYEKLVSSEICEKSELDNILENLSEIIRNKSEGYYSFPQLAQVSAIKS